LHIRYTAREGGGLLRNNAVANLNQRISESQAAGSVRLFSVRHEFPAEWTKFKSVKIEGGVETAELTLNLREEHYPFWSRGRLNTLNKVEVFAKPAKSTKSTINVSAIAPDGTEKSDPLPTDVSLGKLRVGKLKEIPLPPPTGQFTLRFDDNSMEGLWLVLTWS